MAQLTCLPRLRALHCAGVRFAPAHAEEPQLPVLIRQLEELTIGMCARGHHLRTDIHDMLQVVPSLCDPWVTTLCVRVPRVPPPPPPRGCSGPTPGGPGLSLHLRQLAWRMHAVRR